MVTLNAVLGHWNANALATLAQVDSYFDERLTQSVWPTAVATDDDRKRAIIEASRQIDTLHLTGPRLFAYHRVALSADAPLVDADAYGLGQFGTQRFRFPHLGMAHVRGYADAGAGDALTLIDASLAVPTKYPPDTWVGGSVRITAGTGLWSHVPVTAFDSDTGTLTVGTAFSATLDATSAYTLVDKLPDRFIAAVAEQALYCLEGGAHVPSRHVSEGVIAPRQGDFSQSFGSPQGNRQTTSMICTAAMDYLQDFIDKEVSLKVNK